LSLSLRVLALRHQLGVALGIQSFCLRKLLSFSDIFSNLGFRNEPSSFKCFG